MMAIFNWLLDGMDRVERMERQLAQVDCLVTTVADLKYQVGCLQDRSNDRPDVLDDMDQVTVAREELADMQCVLLEELGLEDEAESAEELAQRAVREIRQLRSELNAMVIGKRKDY